MNNRLFLALFASLSLTPFSTPPAHAETKGPEWATKMQSMKTTLSELLSTVSQTEKYEDPKNRSKIESQIKELSKISHELKSTDPAIQILAGHLKSDIDEAYQAFHNGHRDYARGLIRSLSQSCVACHSRNSSGVQFNDLTAADTKQFGAMELGNFYTATRQFDRAIAEFRKIVKVETFSGINPWTWDEALRQSVVIAVRVKRDPDLTATILDEALAIKDLPYFIRQYATQWRNSVREWKKSAPVANSEKGMNAEAQRLIAQAKKMQKYPADHSADILYLRASTVLFDQFDKFPNGKLVGEALFMQGICHESIRPRTFENLPRMFYEDCIRRVPHSKIAQACYANFEEQTYLGFTGSSGTDIPESVKQKLLDLWALALPLNDKDKMH